MAEPTIGVVIIGRNEGERLRACLASLASSSLPTVYVDSASTDGSPAVAHAAGAQVLALDLARPFTAARARNEGAAALIAAHATLHYLQFIDGDCALAPGWLETARAFLDAEPDYAVACGRRRERHPDASSYNRLADIEWATPVGDAAACGGDSLVRTAAFTQVGGFDTKLIAGEEPELCSRLRAAGWRIRRLDAEMTMHDAAMTHLSQWWRRAVRSGFGYAQAWRATRSAPVPLYGRELARAGFWSLGPVVLAVAGAAVHPALLLIAPVLWVGQTLRLAWRFGLGRRLAWQRATLLMLGKFAELWGALKFAARTLAGQTGGTIFYK